MLAYFPEEKLYEAYCKIVACTGVGAFIACEKENFEKVILISIPENMHSEFSSNLLQCAINICTNEPYYWQVDNKQPEINSNTTYKDLYNNWFLEIIS